MLNFILTLIGLNKKPQVTKTEWVRGQETYEWTAVGGKEWR